LIVGDEWAYSDSDIWDQDLRPMLMDTGGGAVLISKPLGENPFYDKYVEERNQTTHTATGKNLVRGGRVSTLRATRVRSSLIRRLTTPKRRHLNQCFYKRIWPIHSLVGHS